MPAESGGIHRVMTMEVWGEVMARLRYIGEKMKSAADGWNDPDPRVDFESDSWNALAWSGYADDTQVEVEAKSITTIAQLQADYYTMQTQCENCREKFEICHSFLLAGAKAEKELLEFVEQGNAQFGEGEYEWQEDWLAARYRWQGDLDAAQESIDKNTPPFKKVGDPFYNAMSAHAAAWDTVCFDIPDDDDERCQKLAKDFFSQSNCLRVLLCGARIGKVGRITL